MVKEIWNGAVLAESGKYEVEGRKAFIIVGTIIGGTQL